jgi:Flp pilus assembly protein TadG
MPAARITALISRFRRDTSANKLCRDQRRRRMASTIRIGLRHFVGDRAANVAVTFAIVMVPTIFLLGMALDYTHAQRMKSNLDAATDAAAVAAVTSSMMQQTPTVAQATAKKVFNITANALVSNSNLASQPSITVAVNCTNPDATTGYCTYPPCPGADSVHNDAINSNNQVVRNVQVCYNGASTNAFPSVLNQASWPFTGKSATRNQNAPNINFYLLLDDSPSMAIGADSLAIKPMLPRTICKIRGAPPRTTTLSPAASASRCASIL